MQAISIHIGLDHVDPGEYCGWHGKLGACEADARAMAELAEAQGIAVRAVLLSADATFDRVAAELRTVAAMLQRDDYLLITFAGHGASYDNIPTQPAGAPASLPGAESGVSCDLDDEADGRDEAWCLYDTYLLDDELHGYFCKLAPGVRVCVVSDSCFSGTVTRGEVQDGASGGPTVRRHRGPPIEHERRLLPSTANALYRRQFQTRYQARSAAAAPLRSRVSGAHIVLLAACQDDETAMEGAGHGLFTQHLLATWDHGRFQGSHAQMVAAIECATRPRQRPNLYLSGAPSAAFAAARPFTQAQLDP